MCITVCRVCYRRTDCTEGCWGTMPTSREHEIYMYIPDMFVFLSVGNFRNQFLYGIALPTYSRIKNHGDLHVALQIAVILSIVISLVLIELLSF